MRAGTHALVDEEDALVAPDVEGPARRERLIRIHDAVAARDLTARVAQNRKIHGQRLREVLVGLWRIDAGGKVCDVEGPNVVAALTERLALRGSGRGEGLGEPGQDDNAPVVVGELVGLSVGAWQLERRRGIANLQLDGRRTAGWPGRRRFHRGRTPPVAAGYCRQQNRRPERRRPRRWHGLRIPFRAAVSL
jgi:hypothetical protein